MNHNAEINLHPKAHVPVNFEPANKNDVELIRDHLALRRHMVDRPTSAAPLNFERLELASID